MSKVRRTLLKMVIHVVHLISDLVGDDVASKAVRHGLLRMVGAHIDPTSNIHGGSLFSWPSHLHVAANVFINRRCYFDLEAPITIERGATVGHGTTLVTTDHSIGPSTHRAGPYSARPIRIGAGAWLGANCTVLPGVTIGDGAVVAAGAIVNRNVEPNALVAGVPARFVKFLADGEITRLPPHAEHA